ncbi:unnamed protein product [Peronospora destructor]|uniref:Uncharacterized protein n=1 Tax=Peronospora destructor TaxID=86335 RepID=A0AAV0TEH6_9STRA|nr:unnamed protein product [Peronospora destructor]
MGNTLSTSGACRVVLGNALTTSGTATNTTQSVPSSSMVKQPTGKPYSLSDSTVSLSLDGDNDGDNDDDDLMQQTAGRRRRRESTGSFVSDNSTMDAMGSCCNNDSKHRKSLTTGASTSLSLVSSVLLK